MISVVIPNYNHARFLKLRIDSVLNQSYKDLEIIILDDCSTDNSRDIIELYRGNDKIKHIVYNQNNSGSTFKQWEKGINLSSGDYIWIAESDDWADPFLMEVLMRDFSLNNDIVLSYSQSYKVDKDGLIKGNWFDQVSNIDVDSLYTKDFILDGNIFIQKFLIFKNVIPNASAVLFKKSIYYEVRGVDDSIKYCADWQLWLKILTKGKVSFSHKSLNYFRFHENSVIAKSSKESSFFKKYDIIMRKSYCHFLKNQNIQPLLKLNNKFISDECFIETNISKKNKEYLNLIIYLYESIKYSDSKLKLIKKYLNKFFN